MKIVFNVTMSGGWGRPPVGLVRVEYELAKYLSSFYSKDKITLCTWDNILQSFQEIDLSSYLSRMLLLEKSMISKLPSLRKKGPMVFNINDLYVSFGNDWDAGVGYFAELRRLKKDYLIRIVSCSYDLVPIIVPQFCQSGVAARFPDYLLEMSYLSDHILCISESTRRDLKRFLEGAGFSTLPISSVFRLGDSIAARNSETSYSPLPPHVNSENFLLYVSTVERRKNHSGLYLAYRKIIIENLVEESSLPDLVFVGMKAWGVSEFLTEIDQDPLVRDRVHILDGITDQALRWLYENCRFSVYPSFYEGWGLPVGESLSYGKPVISSNAASLPEVGGDLVPYIDPYSSTQMAQTIAHFLNTPGDLENLQYRIKSTYKASSWARAALQVKSVIDSFFKDKCNQELHSQKP